MSRFFIERPILAVVIGLVVMLAGALSLLSLPVAQYPTVAPPRQRLRAVRMLSDAGIHVNVALAPVLPHITDAPESIEAVVRAARDAGAAKVWHNTLYLHDITRDSFFAYLREYKPELIAQYAQEYRGTYAPRAIADRIDTEVEAALQQHPARDVEHIRSQAVVQLSLI